jgi:hypothetical protein
MLSYRKPYHPVGENEMKEDLEISLNIALKFKRVFTYAIDKQSQLAKIENISDEMADTLLFQIEVFKSLDILLDELIDLLNNRIKIFGNEGIEKQYRVEEL